MKITDVSKLIEFLGGYEGTAAAFGVTEQAVGNWISRGLPPRRHFEAAELLRERGVRVDKRAFQPAERAGGDEGRAA